MPLGCWSHRCGPPNCVSTTPGNGNRTPTHADTREGPTATTREAGCAAPPSFQTVSLGDNYIRAALQGTVLSTTATSLLCNAWREGTKKQYDSTLRRWKEFCCTQLQWNEIIYQVNYLIDNCFTRYNNSIFQQVIGIPMGSNSASHMANIFVHIYEKAHWTPNRCY